MKPVGGRGATHDCNIKIRVSIFGSSMASTCILETILLFNIQNGSISVSFVYQLVSLVSWSQGLISGQTL